MVCVLCARFSILYARYPVNMSLAHRCSPRLPYRLPTEKIEITANGPSAEKCYVKSLKFNGKNYNHNYFNYADLLKGARLKYEMSDAPVKTRGIRPEDVPYSMTNDL